MNARLEAALSYLEKCTESLKVQNRHYQDCNNRFASWVNRWTNGQAPAEWQNEVDRLKVKNYTR